MYEDTVSISSLSVSAMPKSKEKEQRDVLHVPVHLLLVGVDPVQGRIQKETQRENKKDK